jgi:primosomal protein N'
MYVIQVTPLIRGTQLESLSYFSSTKYENGTFLHAPIRKKNQLAIVTSCKPVTDTKSTLRSASFSLRRLPTQKDFVVLPESLRKTAALLAKRYPVSDGAILYNLLPPDVRNGTRTYPNITTKPHDEDSAPQILTGRTDERFLAYQSHIRGNFAHRGSTLFIVPTTSDIGYAVKSLAHGIDDRLVVISSAHTKRKQDEVFLKLQDIAQPKLIITTPAYAYLERNDIRSIIVEQSASAHYVMRTRPYLDHRESLITYAEVTGRSILLGDTVPRTEDETKRRQDVYLTYGEEVRRIVFPAPLEIISQKDKSHVEAPFELFSPRLIKTVELTLEAKGTVFLYSARRGLAPVVACIDCGYIFRCPDSNTPYSLIRTKKNGAEQRWFASSTSGRRVRAADTCNNCGSWRLRERGIGIQQVYDEWRTQFPKHQITLIDSETAPTSLRAKKIIDNFYKEKTGVLIGTQMALPYISRGVDVSAVISLDAARSTPTWRADESLFRLLLRLRELSAKEVLVQTRTEPDNLLEYAMRGAVERFYDEEIGIRQLLKYPPFSNFILLTWSSSPDNVLKAEEVVQKIIGFELAEYYTNPLSTPTKKQRHALIRINANDQLAFESIISKLKDLPPYVKIEINPARIV